LSTKQLVLVTISEVGKTLKLVVATPKVTTPSGSTTRSDNKLAQVVLKKEKGKVVEPDVTSPITRVTEC